MPNKSSLLETKAKGAPARRRKFDVISQKATGAKSPEAASVRLYEVTSTLSGDGIDQSGSVAKVLNVLETMEELAPRDAFERMLIHQMMAAHHAAMECYRRAMIGGQTFEGRDSNLKHAQKLTALYAMQLETLNKHRGKGQQKVTVEHVNVAAGGQAIVGNLDQRGAPTSSLVRRKVAPPRIAHESAVPNPLDPPETAVPAATRTKTAHG